MVSHIGIINFKKKKKKNSVLLAFVWVSSRGATSSTVTVLPTERKVLRHADKDVVEAPTLSRCNVPLSFHQSFLWWLYNYITVCYYCYYNRFSRKAWVLTAPRFNCQAVIKSQSSEFVHLLAWTARNLAKVPRPGGWGPLMWNIVSKAHLEGKCIVNERLCKVALAPFAVFVHTRLTLY